MKTEKNMVFFSKRNFAFFKLVLWLFTGFLFLYFSILIPATTYNNVNEIITFFCLVVVVNIHTSHLYDLISKKSKFLYFIVLAGSILFCVLLEILLFSKSFDDVYSFWDKKLVYFFSFFYIFIRDFILFIFFFWVQFFDRTFFLYQEKEKFHKEEIALLIEKQEFEKNFSRKKLLPHYFFNILEHINLKSFANDSDNELLNKVKFILYYFLVDAEKEEIELDKELMFYKYYIELENFIHQKNIAVNFSIIGQTDSFIVIPLLFEPLIGNAMKYTKHDGSGWVDIKVDALHFPILKFHCRNNYSRQSSNIISSDNGLKIFEQRLSLCYKNKYSLIRTQNDDLYEILLSVEVV